MEKESLKPESLEQIEKHHNWYLTKTKVTLFLIIAILLTFLIPLPTFYETNCAVPLVINEPALPCPKKFDFQKPLIKQTYDYYMLPKPEKGSINI